MTSVEKARRIAKLLTDARNSYLKRKEEGKPSEDFIIASNLDSERAKDISKRIRHIELSISNKKSLNETAAVDELTSSLEKICTFAHSHYSDLLKIIEAENLEEANPKGKGKRTALEKSLEVLHR